MCVPDIVDGRHLLCGARFVVSKGLDCGKLSGFDIWDERRFAMRELLQQ
jgi:hypothetical protein